MPHARKCLNFKNKDMWYLVGLITTDGNLSLDGRHIDITSKHRNFLEKLRKILGLKNKIGIKHSGSSTRHYYHFQISNRNFYEFLLLIGLTPRKSLTLGELKIPAEWFSDFVRGVIDGDGCIRRWIHPSNKGEQWSLRIYSASPVFIHWLKRKVEEHFLAKGQIHYNSMSVSVLKYGKLAAKRILGCCYYDGCLGLDRKTSMARLCGASDSGWSRSKTVMYAAQVAEVAEQQTLWT